MSFSIRATIRELLVPKHKINCSKHLWRQIVGELESRGKHKHEAGAFLLGIEVDGRREIKAAVYYDDLEKNAYSSGVCILHGQAFVSLWERCRATGMTVVADVHTHRKVGYQSEEDRTNPMVAQPGHIAIILPNFASWPVDENLMGIYEYQGQHSWVERSTSVEEKYFYAGFWS